MSLTTSASRASTPSVSCSPCVLRVIRRRPLARASFRQKEERRAFREGEEETFQEGYDVEDENDGSHSVAKDACEEEIEGLTKEEDYVTPGNRVVLDACDDLFEMVEEEMKVLREASELLEMLGVSMGTSGMQDFEKRIQKSEEEEGSKEEQ